MRIQHHSSVLSLLSVSVALAISAASFAGTAAAAGNSNAILALNNSVSMAVTGTLMNYQEHINPGPADTESGWMPGFKVAGSYLDQQDIYLHLGYEYDSGTLNYMGANLETGAPSDSTDSATTQRFLGKIGYAFWMSPDLTAIPYVAAGYQSWNRNLAISGGQEIENYSTGLVGAGALLQYHAMPRLVLSANLEMLATTGGGMTPNITGISAPSANFLVSGEEKLGLSANYRIVGPMSAFAGLDYTHFDYTGGAMGPDYLEPSSATNLFGLDAGVRYAF